MNYCSISFHLAYHDRHRSHSKLIELILNLIVLFHRDKVIKSHTMSTPHNLSHTRFQLINIQASYISCQNLEQILGHSNNFVYYKLIIFTQYQMHNSLYCLLNKEVSIPSIYSLTMQNCRSAPLYIHKLPIISLTIQFGITTYNLPIITCQPNQKSIFIEVKLYRVNAYSQSYYNLYMKSMHFQL